MSDIEKSPSKAPLGRAGWYVVQTRVNQEEKVNLNLERQGFATYFPRHLKRRRHARKTEFIPRPLYPRYLFAALDPARQQWRSINSTYGVSNLVCTGELPTPVDPRIIEGLRGEEGQDGFIDLKPAMNLKPGSPVSIVGGAFTDQLGLYEGLRDDDRVTILLELLGRKVRVSLDQNAIEPVQ